MLDRHRDGNDRPKRVIGLALASALVLKISVLVFPGLRSPSAELTLRANRRRRRRRRRGWRAGAAVAATIPFAVIAIMAPSGVLTIHVALAFGSLFCIGGTENAQQRKRRTGKCRRRGCEQGNSNSRHSNQVIQLHVGYLSINLWKELGEEYQ
jgi:hypothetical protein